MSRYFFHVWTGKDYQTDELGVELSGADEAYLEAVKGACGISFDLLHEGRSAASYRFDVVDRKGRLVHAVRFSEAMGQSSARQPASAFVAGARRGQDLSADLVRAISTAQQSLQALSELLASLPSAR